MTYAIDEDLALNKIKASLKQTSFIINAFINTEGQLVFNFTNGSQVIIDLKEVVRSY